MRRLRLQWYRVRLQDTLAGLLHVLHRTRAAAS